MCKGVTGCDLERVGDDTGSRARVTADRGEAGADRPGEVGCCGYARRVTSRIEQRDRLRPEQPPDDVVVVVRGGTGTLDKLRRHALRTARAWDLDGAPLHGISVFAVLDQSLDELLRARFTTFRAVHLTTAGALRDAGFELLTTGLRPHLTVRLIDANDVELQRLLALLGPARHNQQYGR